jgi:hypothetical protein
MDAEMEIQSLHAETMALSFMISHILRRISASDSSLAQAISAGFDDAANGVENLALRAGKAASPHHLVKAIRIIEELRTATLGNEKKPRHGI